MASAHGRFQPLHNGHMEYLLTAKSRCDFLWIGITAPDPTDLRRYRDTSREKAENNPLSYFERVGIITDAFVDAGVPRNEFGVVPFPIETPEHLVNYLPTSVPCLTTIYDDWNRQKIAALTRLGYRVEVLYERSTKEISGASIRAEILRGSDQWTPLVPRATVRGVRDYDVAGRLRRLVAP